MIGELPRLVRLALQVAVLAAATGAYVYRNVGLALEYVTGGPSDFSHYWAAARAMLRGASPFAVHNFDYPALVAFVTAPVALLPYPQARLLWFWLGHALVLLAAVLTWRLLGRGLTAAVAVAVVWGCGGTVAANLVLGQVSPLLLVLLVVALGATSTRWHGQPRAAAIALAAGLKLWPAALAAAALVARDWRGLWRTVLLTAAAVALPLAVVATGCPAPHLPQSSGFWAGTPAYVNLSFPATVLRAATLETPVGPMPEMWVVGNNPRTTSLSRLQATLSVGSAVVGFCAGLTVMAVAVRRRPQPDLAVIAVLVALTLAWAPVSWYHYRIMHFPGLAWLVLGALEQRRPGRLGALAVLTAGLTWTHVIDPARIGVPADFLALYCTAQGLLVPLLELVLVALYLGSSDGSSSRRTSPAYRRSTVKPNR